ncbi:MAG: kinase-like domain-containing protein [Benjaminiella poitrasii]|nr:MAG: kinase-like domain-containing protein [Benjaminiella poitrasii]
MSRLVREISLMEVLDHPNIVRLYETYETTDSLYLVMEYVEGLNLEEFLEKRGGSLEENEARTIFRQMAAAMDYCHSRWVVHRDLKAPNILLTKDHQVKIADFGLGNRFGRRRLKTICGSMLYYSPEIINGHGYTGPEVDCWCLGVSLYRMTVGVEPFSKASTVGILRRDVTTGNFTIPDTISKELRNTIMKCMAVDKTKRARVYLALKGDDWLTNNGTLPDIPHYDTQITLTSSYTMEETEKTLKYMYMKDIEEEKKSKKLIKRTIVCHPKSPSMYFTSLIIPHSSKSEDIFSNSERQRHAHLQRINDISYQIQLFPARNAGINKSPFRHLLRKLKQPDTLRKSASNMSLSQLYQRVAKDQIHYYMFSLSPQVAIQLTGIGESSLSLQENIIKQDEVTMMLVICGICDTMGISYHRTANDRLICVMALNDYIDDYNKPPSSRSSTANLSDTNRSSSQVGNSRFSKFKRLTSHVISSFLPHHSSTLVAQDSRSVRLSPFLNTNGGSNSHFTIANNMHRNIVNRSSQSSHQSQTMATSMPTEGEGVLKKPPGIAVFSIEIISLSKDIQKNRVVAVKLSKFEGSSKVFRIACGWITGVIRQNITTTQLSDQFNTLMATDIPSNDSSLIIPKPKQPLSRPKSVATLFPVMNDSPTSTTIVNLNTKSFSTTMPT